MELDRVIEHVCNIEHFRSIYKLHLLKNLWRTNEYYWELWAYDAQLEAHQYLLFLGHSISCNLLPMLMGKDEFIFDLIEYYA